MNQRIVILLFSLSFIGVLVQPIADRWLPVAVSESPYVVIPSHNDEVRDCQPLIEKLKRAPDWETRLYDPVISTPEQLEDRIRTYEEIYSCLSQSVLPLSAEQQSILRLTGFFLIFTDGLYAAEGGSTLDIVDLSVVDDPAIQRIRDQAGVPAPPGYVFVRSYASREAMPLPIRQIFEELNVAGVTMFTRYIAVLDENKSTWAERALQVQSLPRTISHELVHTYVNSNLGIDEINRLPTWYHEGLAIYFSHSGENQAIITPNFTLYTTPPPDYIQYDLNFKFLEANLGRELLLEKVRQSIANGESRILLEGLDIMNESELPSRSLAWKAEQEQIRTIGGTAVLLIMAYLLISGRLNQIPSPAASCEACGSIYWLWNKSKLHQHSPPARIWIEGDLGAEFPYSKHVHQVCQRCSTESQELRKAYEERMLRELASAREQANRVYRTWLQFAPLHADQSDQNISLLPIEEAIITFTEAALATKYSPPWQKDSAAFEFADSSRADEPDFITSAPAGYKDVVQAISPSADTRLNLLGSVAKNLAGNVIIIWREATQRNKF